MADGRPSIRTHLRPVRIASFPYAGAHVLCSRRRLRRDMCHDRQAFPAAVSHILLGDTAFGFRGTKSFDSRKEAAGDGVSGITATLAHKFLYDCARTRNDRGPRVFPNDSIARK